MAAFPAFKSVDFLKDHIQKTMHFYHPRCIDPAGGFFHFFKDNGDIYDTDTRHLVSSTRFILTMQKPIKPRASKRISMPLVMD